MCLLTTAFEMGSSKRCTEKRSVQKSRPSIWMATCQTYWSIYGRCSLRKTIADRWCKYQTGEVGVRGQMFIWPTIQGVYSYLSSTGSKQIRLIFLVFLGFAFFRNSFVNFLISLRFFSHSSSGFLGSSSVFIVPKINIQIIKEKSSINIWPHNIQQYQHILISSSSQAYENYYQIFKMSKQTPVRNWKYVHHHRKQSEESLDNSIDSVQSSKSGKFNRFQFTRKEEKPPLPLPLPLQRDSRQPIFVFTGKSRDKNHDRSILSKYSGMEKDSDTSKLSENEPVLRGISSAAHKTDRELLFKQGETPREGRSEAEGKSQLMILHTDAFHGANVKEVLKQVQCITQQFRKVIALFTKKYRDMRFEWDRSFKQLLALQVKQETQTIQDLKAQLERKQQEIEQLSRISFEKHTIAAGSAVKPTEGSKAIANSFDRLAISKVEHPKEAEPLSRTNTIADFLSTQAMREDRPPGLQLRNLRQTIKRMHQILEQ